VLLRVLLLRVMPDLINFFKIRDRVLVESEMSVLTTWNEVTYSKGEAVLLLLRELICKQWSVFQQNEDSGHAFVPILYTRRHLTVTELLQQAAVGLLLFGMEASKLYSNVVFLFRFLQIFQLCKIIKVQTHTTNTRLSWTRPWTSPCFRKKRFLAKKVPN